MTRSSSSNGSKKVRAQTTAERTGRSVAAVYKAMAKIRKSLGDCVSRTLAMKGRA